MVGNSWCRLGECGEGYLAFDFASAMPKKTKVAAQRIKAAIQTCILHCKKAMQLFKTASPFSFYFRPVSRLSSITARTMIPMTRMMPTIPISIIGSVVIHEVR